MMATAPQPSQVPRPQAGRRPIAFEATEGPAVAIPRGGLTERVMPLRGGLRQPPPWLHDRVVRYGERVTLGRDAAQPFRESPACDSAVGVETTVWALTALHHVGADAALECLRPRIQASLDAAYNPALELYEPSASQAPAGVGVWRLHNDAVTRLGFELLGERPHPFPRGKERLRAFPWAPAGDGDLDRWLERTWAGDPRAAAKATFQYLRLYTGLTGIQRVEDLNAHGLRVLAYLETRRDRATGFIGMGTGVELGWAMRGHRNLALNLLWPLGAGEPGLERMIDATLACQREDGLFHDGGLCANMDAVHLLAEYGLRTQHRRAEAVRATRRCVRALFALLGSADGGFWFEVGERHAEAPPPRTTNGLAFALFTLRYWQALDADSRNDTGRALALLGAR